MSHSMPTARRLPSRKLLAPWVFAVFFAFFTLAACSTSAAPSECIRAAERVGLPESMIEQIKKPGDLNALERIALREALKRAGIDDVCKLGDG